MVLVSGCTSYPVYEPRYDYGQAVSIAPPPSRYEYSGYPPVVGHIWIGGYWNWAGGSYAWVPGRWEAPRPGYYWTPHRWERDGSHWRQFGGRWENEARRHVAPAPMPRVEQQENLRPPAAPVIRGQPEHVPTPERAYTPESRDAVRRSSEVMGAPRAAPGFEPRQEPVSPPRPDSRGINSERDGPHRSRSDDRSRDHGRDRDGDR